MEYGELMKDIRFRKLLNQSDVAEILGIARSTYNDYEQQYVIIPIKHLLVFCDYFDISVDYFLGLTKVKQYTDIKKEVDLRESGIRIRRLRKENGLKQGDLAKKLQSTGSILSKNERGHNIISTINLYAICTKFNVSADYLLGRIENITLNKKSKELVKN